MAENCNTTVDYSKDSSGGKILPFKFTLTDDSILHPTEGQRQKFCYKIEATGRDTFTDSETTADLSHFLLGICENIVATDFHSVTVTINGEDQNVEFGTNVEIKTTEHPDDPTGCVGLKFNFPLDKEMGNTMTICFELNSVFDVGSTNVCLFGGDVTKKGMSICGPVCTTTTGCTKTIFQQETVQVPIAVRPFANTGDATVICCGNPVITRDETPPTDGQCHFIVTQTICVEIPITFGANVTHGTTVSTCAGASIQRCPCLDDSAYTEIVSDSTVSCSCAK